MYGQEAPVPFTSSWKHRTPHPSPPQAVTHTTAGKEICKHSKCTRGEECISPMSTGTQDARVSTLAEGAPRSHEPQQAHAPNTLSL